MPTQVVTLLKTIPSGSHNAPYSEELGEHWPEGQKFKLLPLKRQESIRRFYRTSNTSTAVEQIGGEEVIVTIPNDKFKELFGINPPIGLPTKKDGDVRINGPNGEVAFLKKCSSGKDWHLRVDGIRDHSRFGDAEHIREDITHFQDNGCLPRGERW